MKIYSLVVSFNKYGIIVRYLYDYFAARLVQWLTKFSLQYAPFYGHFECAFVTNFITNSIYIYMIINTSRYLNLSLTEILVDLTARYFEYSTQTTS